MKAHHPVEFLAATLTANSGRSDDVVKYVNTCREMRIPGPSSGRERLGPDLHPGRLRDPLRARGREGRRRGGRSLDPRGARGAGAVPLPDDFCSRVDLRLNNRKVIETLVKSGSFDSLGRSRASLTAGLESAVDVAAAHREAAASSQNVLFDEPAETRHEDRFADLPEWSADEKIRYEKETLGFYITGHPLARFEEEIALFGDVTAETAREKIDQQVRIVGLVAALKKSQIRKGRTRKDDGEGGPRRPDRERFRDGFREPPRKGGLVARSGEGRARDRNDPALLHAGRCGAGRERGGGPIEVIAREIEPLEGLREESAREVVLLAGIPETLDETFAGVKELLEASPGDIPVSFELRRAGHFEARVRLGPRYAVRPTPLLTERLESLLGPKSVHYRYAAS